MHYIQHKHKFWRVPKAVWLEFCEAKLNDTAYEIPVRFRLPKKPEFIKRNTLNRNVGYMEVTGNYDYHEPERFTVEELTNEIKILREEFAREARKTACLV